MYGGIRNGWLVGGDGYVAARDGFDCHECPCDGALQYFDVDFNADAVALFGLSQPLSVRRLQQQAGVERRVGLHLKTETGVVETENGDTDTTTHCEDGRGKTSTAECNGDEKERRSEHSR